jgi:N-acetylglutamate synthase
MRNARSSSATGASSMHSAAEAPAPAEIRALEEAGSRLWVAPETEELDGWLLRHANGLTGRGNSVLPRAGGEIPLDEKIARAESWYGARGLPARFQLTSASLPESLAITLGRRGYALDQTPTGVFTATVAAAEADARVELRETPDDAWVDLWAGSRSFADRVTARALLSGSPGTTVFARIDGAAVGRGVAYADMLGITSMFTIPGARRRGLGRALVSALLAWGADNGSTGALIQVERGNDAARALYDGFGFVERYEYAYAVAAPR